MEIIDHIYVIYNYNLLCSVIEQQPRLRIDHSITLHISCCVSSINC